MTTHNAIHRRCRGPFRAIACGLVVVVLTLPSAVAFAADDDAEPTVRKPAARIRQDVVLGDARPRLHLRLLEDEFRLRAAEIQLDREKYRVQFEKELASQIHDLDASYQLSEAQCRKLQLAGRGDIKRYLDKLLELLEPPKSNHADAREDRAPRRINVAYLNKLRTGLFDDDSLFVKTIRKTLTAEQLAKYDADKIQEAQSHHEAVVIQGLATLKHRIGLSHAQVPLISDLLNEAAPFKENKENNVEAYHLVLYRLSKLSPEKFELLLNEQQRKLLERETDKVGYLEAILIANGAIEAPQPPAKPVPNAKP